MYDIKVTISFTKTSVKDSMEHIGTYIHSCINNHSLTTREQK